MVAFSFHFYLRTSLSKPNNIFITVAPIQLFRPYWALYSTMLVVSQCLKGISMTFLTTRISSFASVTAFAIGVTVLPSAQAEQTSPPNTAEVVQQTQIEQNAAYSAVVPAEDPEEGVATPQSAGGTTPAPGGNGAYVGLNVSGNGLHVDTAYVNYFPGTDIIKGNAHADEFELSWYEGGQRREERRGADAGWVRATQQWGFNRSIDAGPMCGRIQKDGHWSNFVCVEIKP